MTAPPRRTALADRLRAPDDRERAAAAVAVRKYLEPTPLLPATVPGPFGEVPAWLKLETLQPGGAFKVRGAVAALSSLRAGLRAVSASAGNHALGMAWAAGRLGVPVTLVTPRTASAVKVAALEAYAHVPASRVTWVQHGSSYEEAEAFARGLVAHDPEATYVSAYSDFAVIAGASSIGEEIAAVTPSDEQVSVITPVGGGGLASGLALWAARRPGTRVIGAEAAASPGVGRSVDAGRRVDVQVGPTIADGLSGNLEDGCPTPGILRAAADAGLAEIVDLAEEDLRRAMRWLFEHHGVVAEGAGAAGVAAVLTGRAHPPGRVVVLVTGRNVTPATYAEVLTGPA